MLDSECRVAALSVDFFRVNVHSSATQMVAVTNGALRTHPPIVIV